MPPNLTHEIELYLLAHQGWISAGELCQRFDINERALRGKRHDPGLLTEYAISSDHGYRHVRYATPAEFDAFVERLRMHGIAELYRVKRLRHARQTTRAGQLSVELPTAQPLHPIHT